MVKKILYEIISKVSIKNLSDFDYITDYEPNDYFLADMNSSKVKSERWVVPEEFLSGMIIKGRFKVGDFLGGGYTGFVRNGMWNRHFYVFFLR